MLQYFQLNLVLGSLELLFYSFFVHRNKGLFLGGDAFTVELMGWVVSAEMF